MMEVILLVVYWLAVLLFSFLLASVAEMFLFEGILRLICARQMRRRQSW